MDDDRGHPHLLLWYVSGDLAPAQARETEAHLAHCRECTAEAQALASMLQNLKDGIPGELPGLETETEPADSPPAGTHADPPVRDLAPAPYAWLKRRLPALSAVAATAALLAILTPSLGRMIDSDTRPSIVREARPVVFAPVQRGAGDAIVLTGDGPWAISVVLPFGAPAGLYDLRIEDVDQPAHPVMTAALSADIEGRLSVMVEHLPRPGKFVMSVRPRDITAATPYVYAFQTVAGAGDGA